MPRNQLLYAERSVFPEPPILHYTFLGLTGDLNKVIPGTAAFYELGMSK